MSIPQYMSDPDRAKAYRDWLNLPETEIFLNLCENAARPGSLGVVDGNNALYQVGIQAGFAFLLQTIRGFDDIQLAEQAKARTEENFGELEILKDQGYSPERVLAHLKKQAAAAAAVANKE
jgi:hypothetical protein